MRKKKKAKKPFNLIKRADFLQSIGKVKIKKHKLTGR